MNVHAYQQFNDMIIYYDELRSFKDIDIIANPCEVDVTSVLFVHNDYTLGIWITAHKLTIAEVGFHTIPETVFNLKDVTGLTYNQDAIEITLGDKHIILDLENIKNSVV